jgi:hypothetical protein
LRQRARQQGVEDNEALEEVLRICKILLSRFRRHPLWKEIQAAAERYLSIPLQRSEGTDYIDVLYLTPPGWKVIDFHTGSLHGEAAVQAAVDLRRSALQAKCRAVQDRIGVTPQIAVCFLDVDHQVVVQRVDL